MHYQKIFATLACALTLGAICPAQALQNPSPWAVEGIEDAAWLNTPSLSILEAKGTITRAEFCTLAVHVYERISGKTMPVTQEAYFMDCYEPTVNAAFALGLVQGRAEGIFAPEEPITRQDLCVLLYNINREAGFADMQDDYALEIFPDYQQVRDYAHDAMQFMLEKEVISGMPTTQANGEVWNLLAPTTTATREQALILASRYADLYPPVEIEVAPEVTPDTSADAPATGGNFDLSTIPTTTAEKMAFLFGAGNDRYEEEKIAYENTSVLTIPVWTLNSKGETVSSSRDIRVHTALVPIFTALFDEIYASDERFPIKNIGGWAWRSYARSEHRQGTAIDINWEENMECNIDSNGNVTSITCGSLWEPYDNVYSIPAESDLVAIFKKYGFSWGGDAWTTKRDYMHFSFMGT